MKFYAVRNLRMEEEIQEKCKKIKNERQGSRIMVNREKGRQLLD